MVAVLTEIDPEVGYAGYLLAQGKYHDIPLITIPTTIEL
jgi:hypothetical protein